LREVRTWFWHRSRLGGLDWLARDPLEGELREERLWPAGEEDLEEKRVASGKKELTVNLCTMMPGPAVKQSKEGEYSSIGEKKKGAPAWEQTDTGSRGKKMEKAVNSVPDSKLTSGTPTSRHRKFVESRKTKLRSLRKRCSEGDRGPESEREIKPLTIIL